MARPAALLSVSLPARRWAEQRFLEAMQCKASPVICSRRQFEGFPSRPFNIRPHHGATMIGLKQRSRAKRTIHSICRRTISVNTLFHKMKKNYIKDSSRVMPQQVDFAYILKMKCNRTNSPQRSKYVEWNLLQHHYSHEASAMNHHHFTAFERRKIEQLGKIGYSTPKNRITSGTSPRQYCRKTEKALRYYKAKRTFKTATTDRGGEFACYGVV